ncbi:MAG: type II toxin-antitoxin system RelE/ParE family toxin [Phycisphaerales bacterium]
MIYRVVISAIAVERIEAHAAYIREVERLPLRASQWLNQVFQAAASLESMPRRFAVRLEATERLPEVRGLFVQGFLLLFDVDDATRTVTVINARHARQAEDPTDGPGHEP